RPVGPCASYVSSVTGSSTLDVSAEPTVSTVSTVSSSADRIELLQAVADPVRWAVLEGLADATRCVCDIRERVPVPANLLSYHLKVLREAGLVTATRRGRWIDYAL